MGVGGRGCFRAREFSGLGFLKGSIRVPLKGSTRDL